MNDDQPKRQLLEKRRDLCDISRNNGSVPLRTRHCFDAIFKSQNASIQNFPGLCPGPAWGVSSISQTS